MLLLQTKVNLIKKTENMKLSQLHPNNGQIAGVPSNPRTITEEDFDALKKSLRNFIKMMKLRPITIDENGDILGGNMRYQALCKLAEEGVTAEIKNKQGEIVQYYKFDDEIPDEWVQVATDLSPEEKMEFIIKDNLEKGENDYDKLANEWDAELLEDWGVDVANWDPDVQDKKQKEAIKPEVEFAEVLNEANNYIVLQFKNEVDWLQAVTIFGLEKKMCGSTRTDGVITKDRKRIGIARVLDGATALNKIIG